MIEPYYETDLGKLYLGDCLEIMPHLEPVDLVLTDPPYGVDKAEWDNLFPASEVWATLKGVMKTGSSLLVFPGEKDIKPKITMLLSVFDYQWVIPWYKPNAMQFGKTGYSKHSLIWWLSNGEKALAKPKMIDVIVVPMCEKSDQGIGHPSPKPFRVLFDLINNFSESGNMVLDCFFGSGTTAVACERLNRRWIGIEIEEKYCAIAKQRIENERKQRKLFN